MIPAAVRKYVLTGLAGTPDVLDGLLNAYPLESSVWDFRPDPARFTLREIIAHLADWEAIFLGRMQRILAEPEPLLEDMDEGQIAIDRDYAHQDPLANLARFREGRTQMIAFFGELAEDEWERIGHRPPVIGAISLEAFAAMILGHDGYHTQQVAQWLTKSKTS